MVISDPQHGLVFGGLDMLGENEFEGNFFTLSISGDGLTWGTPEAVVTWLSDILRDGAIGTTQGNNNREPFAQVKVTALDGIALAAGETALTRAAGKRTTMVWTPPDGWAPPCVFDIESSQLEPVTDDLADLRLERVFGLRMWALPWTRSVEETVVVDDSTPGAESTTVLDSCSATTGWSASNSGPTVVSGAVRTSMTQSTTGAKTLWLEKASLAMTDATKPYLRVDWSTTLPPDNRGIVVLPPSLTLIADGVEYAPVAVDGSFVWFKIETPHTITAARFRSTGVKTAAGSATYELKINELLATNTGGRAYPNIKQFSLPIGGAVRAPAKIEISHASTSLGDTVLYTWPLKGGYQPVLHPYRTGGGTRTNDAACVSGAREPLDGGPTFTIPVGYVPQGSYLLVARLRTTGTAGRRTITWSAEVSGTGNDQTGVCYVDFPTTNEWIFVILDRLLLPTSRVTPDSARNVILTIDTAATDVQHDVSLIGWEGNPATGEKGGALTIVRAPGFKSVSVVPPNVDDPTEQLLTEDVAAADWTAWGQHLAEPPQLVGTVITTGVAQPVVSASYSKRWLTHAME